jgi:hypothetical protein
VVQKAVAEEEVKAAAVAVARVVAAVEATGQAVQAVHLAEAEGITLPVSRTF